MATRFICDRCGSEEGVGRVVLSLAVSTPHNAKGLPSFDKDLCGNCLKEVVAMIPHQLMPITRS